MIFWQHTFNGFTGIGSANGWSIEIKNKLLSRTRFKVIYTLDESSVIGALSFDIQNRSSVESYLRNILKGKSFTEETEIDTFLRWPKTLNENLITREATTHAIAHLNYALSDAISYLKKKGIVKDTR